MTTGKLFGIVSPVVILAACASAPSRPPPPLLELPAAWPTAGPPTVSRAPDNAGFWERFGSDELSSLIAAARAQNAALAVAEAQTEQAEALARVSGAALYPSVTATVDLLGQSTNNQSLGTVNGAFVDAGLVASYEVDFWGRNRSRAAAGREHALASRCDRATSELVLTAAVADTYFSLLALRERRALAERNVATAQQTLNIVEARAREGTAYASDVAQQRSLFAAQQSAVDRLLRGEGEALADLAALVGKSAVTFEVQGEDLAAVREPALEVGVPADLLARRPDVMKAEADLKASHADVDAARAAFLPRLLLTGSAAVQHVVAAREVSGTGLIYTAMASINQPLFAGGALDGERDLALGRQKEALARYREAVLAATADVTKALRALDALKRQQSSQTLAVEEARRAPSLIEARYREGAEELVSVLDAQRTLARAEDELVEVKLARLRALVSLFKALGGDWRDAPAPRQSSPLLPGIQ